jgi:hypothetical protein
MGVLKPRKMAWRARLRAPQVWLRLRRAVGQLVNLRAGYSRLRAAHCRPPQMKKPARASPAPAYSVTGR